MRWLPLWPFGLALALSACAAPSVAGQTAPAANAANSAPSTIVVAQGAGWAGHQLFGTMPGVGACHVGHESGQVLPDHQCTPGAIDGRVTQATLQETVCRRGGYTSGVRPPVSLTEPAKRRLLQAYGLTGPLSEYELDHLVPLELGGASDVRNLWPEQNIGKPSEFDPGAAGSNAKDGVEDRLHQVVCGGQVSLSAAQQAIVGDWTTAMARLGVKP